MAKYNWFRGRVDLSWNEMSLDRSGLHLLVQETHNARAPKTRVIVVQRKDSTHFWYLLGRKRRPVGGRPFSLPRYASLISILFHFLCLVQGWAGRPFREITTEDRDAHPPSGSSLLRQRWSPPSRMLARLLHLFVSVILHIFCIGSTSAVNYCNLDIFFMMATCFFVKQNGCYVSVIGKNIIKDLYRETTKIWNPFTQNSSNIFELRRLNNDQLAP